jgi:RHH-type proline utilization regulon transcriptional repressor/proline dehydrogenase/delta 1-pyrroline-5-carboxylate dehydrogenase
MHESNHQPLTVKDNTTPSDTAAAAPNNHNDLVSLGSNALTESLMPALSLESQIAIFGRSIFADAVSEKPSFFNKNFWTQAILNWSLQKPNLKRNLFRLIDVLPALETSAEIAEHIKVYLGNDTLVLFPGRLSQWGLNAPNHSLRAKLLGLGVKKGVQEMASQFIAGQDPHEALKQLKRLRKNGFAFTVDLLGEEALSESEAMTYLERYSTCIAILTRETQKWQKGLKLIDEHTGEKSNFSISIKLSALFSQAYPLNTATAVAVLSERLALLLRKAKESQCLIYCDAESKDKWEIVNETYKNVFRSSEFKHYPLPGLVVQAYAKHSLKLVEELIQYAREREGRIAIRLVKGAYWDYETAMAEQNSWESPLFSVKSETDANYERLSQLLLDNIDVVYPAFGSHNIRSLSHACCYAEQRGIKKTDFEIQVLYGMADPIALAFKRAGFLVRHYVPIGELIPGMGYFVRRLLENTSNESFLRHAYFDQKQSDDLLKPPSTCYDQTETGVCMINS